MSLVEGEAASDAIAEASLRFPTKQKGHTLSETTTTLIRRPSEAIVVRHTCDNEVFFNYERTAIKQKNLVRAMEFARLVSIGSPLAARTGPPPQPEHAHVVAGARMNLHVNRRGSIDISPEFELTASATSSSPPASTTHTTQDMPGASLPPAMRIAAAIATSVALEMELEEKNNVLNSHVAQLRTHFQAVNEKISAETKRSVEAANVQSRVAQNTRMLAAALRAELLLAEQLILRNAALTERADEQVQTMASLRELGSEALLQFRKDEEARAASAAQCVAEMLPIQRENHALELELAAAHAELRALERGAPLVPPPPPEQSGRRRSRATIATSTTRGGAASTDTRAAKFIFRNEKECRAAQMKSMFGHFATPHATHEHSVVLEWRGFHRLASATGIAPPNASSRALRATLDVVEDHREGTTRQSKRRNAAKQKALASAGRGASRFEGTGGLDVDVLARIFSSFGGSTVRCDTFFPLLNECTPLSHTLSFFLLVV